MAYKAGNRQATENLGYIYYYGRIGQKDYEKAFKYFVKGALDAKDRLIQEKFTLKSGRYSRDQTKLKMIMRSNFRMML